MHASTCGSSQIMTDLSDKTHAEAAESADVASALEVGCGKRLVEGRVERLDKLGDFLEFPRVLLSGDKRGRHPCESS